MLTLYEVLHAHPLLAQKYSIRMHVSVLKPLPGRPLAGLQHQRAKDGCTGAPARETTAVVSWCHVAGKQKRCRGVTFTTICNMANLRSSGLLLVNNSVRCWLATAEPCWHVAGLC